MVGNILSAIVLSRPQMKSTYNTITLWLTIVDTIYLFGKLFFHGFTSLFAELFAKTYYNHFLFPFFGPKLKAITFIAQTASTYLTVALAIDRYLVVCWPITAKLFWTKKRAHVLSFGVVVFASLYNIPRWMEMETRKLCQQEPNSPYYEFYVIVPSELRSDPNYKKFYIFWAYFIVLNCIPFLSLSFLNLSIFRAVQKSSKIRSTLTSQQKTDISFAIMLLTIVLVYMIANSVYFITDILTYFNIPYEPYWYNVGNLLLAVNSAVNFLIYCVFGQLFREQCRLAFGKKRSKRSPKLSLPVTSGETPATLDSPST